MIQPFTVEPFSRASLMRLLCYLNSADPLIVAILYDYDIEYIPYSKIADTYKGKRIWFKIHVPKTRRPNYTTVIAEEILGFDYTFYISANPGEFRKAKPSGKKDEVIELPTPPTDSESSLLKLLKDQIDSGSNYEHNSRYCELLDQASRLLEFKSEEHLIKFWSDGFSLCKNSGIRNEVIFEKLYNDYFTNFLIPGIKFNPASLLVRIHVIRNIWSLFENSLYGPLFKCGKFALHVYLTKYSYESPDILEVAAKVGNFDYEQGNSCLKEALGATSLEKFYFRLYMATHYFSSAGLIASNLSYVRNRFDPSLLEYDEIRADEGAANAITGLSYKLKESFKNDPNMLRISKWVELLRNNKIDQVNGDFRDLTRITNPILPRLFGRIHLAIAKIDAGDNWVAEGVRELEEIEKEVTLANESIEESLKNTIELNLTRGYDRLESR